MKIICVEEHTSDQELLQAGQPKQKAEAGYFTEVGDYFNGSPEDGDDKLPMTVNFQTSIKLLPETNGGRLAEMDKHGIDMQILSYSNPSQNVPANQQVQLTRQANNRLAQAVRDNPSRFGGFASLPWSQPKAAAEELERAVKELGFVGALLLGRPGDTFLDDSQYEPILAKLNELRVPLYLHPGYPLPQVQHPYYGGLGHARDSEAFAVRLGLAQRSWRSSASLTAFKEIRPLCKSSGNLRTLGRDGSILSRQARRLHSAESDRTFPFHHRDVQAACLRYSERYDVDASV